MEIPEGECPQCWVHAHDKSVHAHLGWREDCPECVAHVELHQREKRVRWW
ncbi:MAG: pRL2-8 [Streptomyces sp.]